MDTKYLKGVLKYMLSAVLCLVLIAYIIYHITGGMQPNLETTPALVSTVESTVNARVTILRNEKIVYAPIKGNVSYLFNDGDKISKGSHLADVYPLGADESVSKRILELDRAIRLLENSNMSEAEKRTDTASTDVLIRNNIYDILNAMDTSDISHADTISDNLLIQLNKRRIITKSIVNFNKQIAALKAERSALSSSLPATQSQISTNNVGYFYSSIDGYENVISSVNIDSISYGDYLEMEKSSPESIEGTENGYPIGKIVTDYKWYIACEIDISELHNYETGKKYSVKFPYNNDTSIPMTMYRILSEAGSDTAVLIFSSDILPSNFNYLRHQTVQIVKESYTGCRVPVTSVRVVNGNAGVYIMQGSQVLFKRIEPLYEFDGYLIVAEQDKDRDDYTSWLSKNDFIIVKGTELYDGKIVG